ncbi:MAG: metallophosphoesterase, partial [Candidatus Micrarchaeaceae archaeon]
MEEIEELIFFLYFNITMFLNKDIELIDGLPIMYIHSLEAVVVADMHLGYEGIMAKKGILLPQINFKKISEMLEKAIDEKKAKQIIVDGDIKNEFSNVDEAEFNELYELIQFTKRKNVELVLIKGNHDNFVERYREPFRLKVYAQQGQIGDYLFFHGEELPKKIGFMTKMLIMGHEHPMLGIYEVIGKIEKLKCFLYGKYRGKKLLVLPAISYFASGTAVNLEPKENLLSPIFKYVDINSMHAIAIGYGSTIDFGQIKNLRDIGKNESV